MSSIKAQSLTPANAARSYKVRAADLPLCCPMPNMTLWNSHPRVYLPIEETGHVECPYCSAQFELIDVVPGHAK